VGPVENLPPRALTTAEKAIISSGNSFGFKLFQTVAASDKDSNVFISPLSVSMALGMTLNGANGTTYDSIRNTLGFNGLTQKEINENFKSLMSLLEGLDDKVIFQIANSVWCRQSFQVDQDFITTNKSYFDAQVMALDFSLPTASQTINLWVDQKTNGKIQKIVPDRIDPLTMMYLINAIYFKGAWTYQFDSTNTRDTLFTLPGGKQTTCKMMHTDFDFDYAENDQYQAVDLPYGIGSFSMTILLPKAGVDLNSFVSGFTETSWQALTREMQKEKGELYFPKFKLEYEKSLNEVLQLMGMRIAFDPKTADFARINKDPSLHLHISSVTHKAFVNVDEDGTEAAAATSVGIGTTVVLRPTKPPFFMHVDHPFMLVIWDHYTEDLLFVGKILQPKL
jgi:serpin B